MRTGISIKYQVSSIKILTGHTERLFPDWVGDLVNDTRLQPQVSTGSCRIHDPASVMSLRCGLKPIEFEMSRGRELRCVCRRSQTSSRVYAREERAKEVPACAGMTRPLLESGEYKVAATRAPLYSIAAIYEIAPNRPAQKLTSTTNKSGQFLEIKT